jgi:Ca2+-transporting ATPase
MAKFNGFTGDYTGLTDEEVKISQGQYGKNELVPEKKETFFSKALQILKEPMFLLLFGTATIYFLLGEPRDGFIMLGFVAFMSGINLFQEWRTDRTLQALKDLSSPQIRVIRNSELYTVDSRDLTVGDLILLEEGDKIPADGCVIELFDLAVDESTLTGESEVVWKKVELTDAEKESHWRKDLCYAGTMVTQGSAIVQITQIGLGTEYGKIGQDITSIPDRPTPLEKQVKKVVKVTGLIGFGMFLMVFLVTFQHSRDIISSILHGITLAMAMIPEEFPVILTVFLAMGAWRLARKQSLIRHIPSVETLGAITVLCVDKTGTLTKNQMTVQEQFCFRDYNNRDVLYWAGLGCETEPYDPMEKAILKAAEVEGLKRNELFSNPLIFEYPFRSDTKMMGHVWKINGESVLAAKGSPESILPLCNLAQTDLQAVQHEQNRMAARGFRVIAIARKLSLPAIPNQLRENVLELVGLIGLADPPREAVPEAIKVCNRAGVRVVMITGDNGVTAKSIAGKIGIQNPDNVITGQELDTLSDQELKMRVKNTNIFARVIPRHKMRIVKALQDNGETVAMTGDGVNDAPALKMSDIGIAMGKRGTGVAKEAADMILLDDNFTTIVDTVKDGRRIYDNIRKAIGYVFVIHIPIALTALITPLLHLPELLFPIHIVLLELIIDPTCSIIFERQTAESGIMDKKPRSSKEALISGGLITKAVLQGLAIFGATFGSYIFALNNHWSVEAARTFSLTILILANLFLVHVNQSNREVTITNIFRVKDKVMFYVNLGILLGLALVIYLPLAQGVVKTASLSSMQIMAGVGIAFLSTVWWEAVKIVQGKK